MPDQVRHDDIEAKGNFSKLSYHSNTPVTPPIPHKNTPPLDVKRGMYFSSDHTSLSFTVKNQDS
jgi:hypothetical protein